MLVLNKILIQSLAERSKYLSAKEAKIKLFIEFRNLLI